MELNLFVIMVVVWLWILCGGVLWGMTKKESRTTRFMLAQLAFAPILFPLVIGISLGKSVTSSDDDNPPASPAE